MLQHVSEINSLFFSIKLLPLSLSFTHLFLCLLHRLPVDSLLSPSIAHSLFHSWLKTYSFHKSLTTKTLVLPQDCLHGLLFIPSLLSNSVFAFSFLLHFLLFLALWQINLPLDTLWVHVKVSYRIVPNRVISEASKYGWKIIFNYIHNLS